MKSGVVLLDKPEGWTSRQAVDAVARLFANGRPPKAGHAGTLDPIATGMLPILLGEATRLADLGLSADKRYRFAVDFSLATDTLDRAGEVLVRHPAAERLSYSALEEAVARMQGEIMQVPPVYSAVKIQGAPAYAEARRGRKVQLAPRKVRITRLAIEAFSPPYAVFDLVCSKGCYVRAVARDLGRALGLGGCVIELRRLSTAGWPPEAMHPFSELEKAPEQALISVKDWAVHALPSLELPVMLARRFVHGQRLPGHRTRGRYAVLCQDRLLGLGEVDARGVLHPKTVMPSARKAFA